MKKSISDLNRRRVNGISAHHNGQRQHRSVEIPEKACGEEGVGSFGRQGSLP
jgi:hypothetical protein